MQQGYMPVFVGTFCGYNATSFLEHASGKQRGDGVPSTWRSPCTYRDQIDNLTTPTLKEAIPKRLAQSRRWAWIFFFHIIRLDMRK